MGQRGKYVLGAALVLSLLGGAAVWGEEAPTTKAAATASATAKVNVNTSNAKALEALPGIGEVKAKAIVAYREKNGPFKTVEDLKKVSGVTTKDLEQMKDKITIEGAVSGTPTAGATAAGTAATGTATAAATTKVNVNTADAKALDALPGIGKARAKAIIAYREKNGPFKTVEDLKKVEGIKAKLAEKLKDRVTVE